MEALRVLYLLYAEGASAHYGPGMKNSKSAAQQPPLVRWFVALHAVGGSVLVFVIVATILGVSDFYR